MNIKKIKFTAVLILSMGLLPFVIADAAVVSSTVQFSPSTSSVTLQVGNKGLLVAALQTLLIKKGYLSAAPTGYFGPLTRSALMAFQKAHNRSETGTLTIPTNQISVFFGLAASSTSPFSPITLGNSGIHVKSVQGFLIQDNLLHIPTSTGYFGSLTRAAVMAFQKARGLPQTGTIDQTTFAAMNGR